MVVIAIIGLLSTLAVIALNSAREKARDAKRVSDIRQVQTSLELYFNDNNAYPSEASNLTMGSGSGACLGSGGFGTTGCASAYMPTVPVAPTPPTGNAYTYVANSSDTSTYTINFDTEGTPTGLATCTTVGAYQAQPSGITCR